jgi:electron transport protein HydN
MTDFIYAIGEKCIGCRTCEVACALTHADSEPMSPNAFFPRLRVIKNHQITLPVMCHQCENAPCVAVCPTAALVQGKNCVTLDEPSCIGCKNCVMACPFGVIEIAAHMLKQSVTIVKCDLCSEVADEPVCISVCPTAALEIRGSEMIQRQANLRRQSTALQSFHSSLK